MRREEDAYHKTEVPDICRVSPASSKHHLRGGVLSRLDVVIVFHVTVDGETKVSELDIGDVSPQMPEAVA